MKFEANKYIVTYCDTDSLLTFPVHPDAPELNQICSISERLGCLKIEKKDIVKFFSTAAKTYSTETASGEVTIKAKGFRLLDKLLKDNDQECLLEKNITKMFTGVTELSKENWQSSSLIFQKQIRVNPIQMVPTLIPKSKSYKMLNFIGPRRQIDLDNWLEFCYERIVPSLFCSSKVDPLLAHNSEATEDSLFRYDCRKTKESLYQKRFTPTEGHDYSVQLLPKIKGILPALPYGFDLAVISDKLPFYKLVM